MTDLIELGIEGVNKIVDKHFHRLPDSALQSKTYHPRNIKKIRRKHRRSSPSTNSFSEEEIEEESLSPQYSHLRSQGDPTMQQFPPPPGFPPQNHMGPGSPPQFPTPPQYSQELPVQRKEYIPASPRTQEPYSPNQYSPSNDRRPPYPRTTYTDDDGYYSDTPRPRRPRAITRRSSSYHGHSRNYSSSRSPSPYNDRQLAHRRRRDSSSLMRGSNKLSDAARRYGLKEELESKFTTSGAGLAVGAVGAVVGGWAAKKAQVAKRGERRGKTNVVLTALGAAVGGLAVNAVVERWEDAKREKGEKSDHEDDWGSKNAERGRDRGGRERYSDDGWD